MNPSDYRVVPTFLYHLSFMDYKDPGLKDSLHSFHKYVLTDLYVPVMFCALEIYTAVSRILRHGVYMTQMKSGKKNGQ